MIYDVCVIGGGPAGLTLADKLTDDTGISLVVLEAGGEKTPNADAARFVTKGETWYMPTRQFMLGGHGHLWGGACPRLDPADFRMRTLFGVHADWPIEYEDLAPYYDVAESLLGVRSRMGAPERLRNDSVFGELSRIGIAGEIPYGDRRYFVDQLLPQLRKRGVEMRVGSVVQNIHEAESGRAVVTYADDATLERRELTARVVVLACGGLSNARIMQMSKSDRQPDGLGNHSGHLGRYLMDHPRNVVKLTRRTAGALKGATEGRFPYDLVKPVSHGDHTVAYGSVRIDGELNVALGLDALSDLLAGLAGDHGAEDAVASAIESLHKVRLDFECMDPPVHESRIGLADELDKYGTPLMATYMHLNTERVASMNKLVALLKTAFGSLGYEVEVVESTGMVGQHPSGSTRMAARPEDGVVDADLKVFETRSIYVLGSSVFPTVGYANPTLTIVSLALRLADHLNERLAASES